MCGPSRRYPSIPRVLGIENETGSIEGGKNADLTVLDDNFAVYSTIVGGNEVYCRQ
jgi:N-acetylglucosamine-6-phosphate deacetylase